MISTNIFVFLSAVITLTESVPLAVHVNNQVCLAEHVRQSGVDPKLIYKTPYDCSPIPRDPKSVKLWTQYEYCARDFVNGTCILDLPYIRSVANDVQFAGVSSCAPAVVSKTLPDCIFEFVDCYFNGVYNCKN